jgi:branched-chain amino acid transport system ATP-binding protein
MLGNKGAKKLYACFSELNGAGAAILLVEQNARMALSVVHRCYVLETGRVALEAGAAELLDNEEVKRAYRGG